MAKKNPPSLSKRPDELLDYEHHSKWSRKAQKLANEMARFMYDALAVPADQRAQVPRVLVYPSLKRRDGSVTLPMSMTGGCYYYHENFIALIEPRMERKEDTCWEYDSFSRSPVIGDFKGTPELVFKADICHELSHHLVDKVLKIDEGSAHGRTFRTCYALLRERFVNPLIKR